MIACENNELMKCFEIAKNLGWSVEYEYDNRYDFAKYSPAGQDFHMSIDTEGNADDFEHNLSEYCSNFDVSYETSIWLDDTGHGANGAPYDMKDLYEDMEAVLEMIEELLTEIQNRRFE